MADEWVDVDSEWVDVKEPSKPKVGLGDLAWDTYARAGMGAYRGLSWLPGVRQLANIVPAKGNAPGYSSDEMSANIPKGNFGQQVVGGTGQALGMLPFAAPFMSTASAMPLIGRSAVASGATGLGMFEGFKKAAEGRPSSEILSAAGEGAKSGAIFGAAGRLGATAIPRGIPGAERIGTSLGMGVAGAAMAPDDERVSGGLMGAGLGLISPSKRLERPYFNEIAGRINNSLIGAKVNRDLLYGNPGEGIAREGITGNTLSQIKTNIKSKLSGLLANLDSVYKSSGKLSDFDSIYYPINKAMARLQRSPKTNSAAITRLQNIIDDLSGSSSGKPLKTVGLNPVEGRMLKQRIDEFVDWSLMGKSDKLINKALKDAYHKADSILDVAVPQAKNLNKRVTDLITANKAIGFEINRIKAKDPVPASWVGIINTPLQVYRNPAIKSRLAAALAKPYENQPISAFPQPPMAPQQPLGLPSAPTIGIPRLTYGKRGVLVGKPYGVKGVQFVDDTHMQLGQPLREGKAPKTNLGGEVDPYGFLAESKKQIGKGLAGIGIGLGLSLGAGQAQAAQYVDMNKIYKIESSGNPNAHNKSTNARGLGQIKPIVLKEWNTKFKDNQYSQDDLFNPSVNKKISSWYMNQEIPRLLKHFKINDTVENRLISYNFGIGNLRKYLAGLKPLPKETKDYIKKFNK